MKQLAFALSLSAVILTARSAQAQPLTVAGAPLDHLVCYKTLDKLTLKTTTDLIAQLQPEFTQKGCTLIRPVEFCVPATKINVSPVPTNPNIVGTPLKNDYVCYLARCKSQIPPPDKKVIDQFGSRLQQNYKISKVCVPAQKAPAGCGFFGKQCSGACPNNTDLCVKVPGAAGTLCECRPKNKPCTGKPDTAGMCGGECLTAGDKCLPTLVGTGDPTLTALPVECTCRPPVDPLCSRDLATGACGGACPKATDKCQPDPATGRCDCQPDNPPCQLITVAGTAPSCGGACPAVSQTCTHDAVTGKCSCSPPPQCAQDANGTCGGPCPPGMSCVLDSTGHCDCKDTPCGSNGLTPPACGGACPLPSQTCALDTTGACNCTPSLPCQPDAAGTCGGNCPAPMRCANIPGTTGCQCQ